MTKALKLKISKKCIILCHNGKIISNLNYDKDTNPEDLVIISNIYQINITQSWVAITHILSKQTSLHKNTPNDKYMFVKFKNPDPQIYVDIIIILILVILLLLFLLLFTHNVEHNIIITTGFKIVNEFYIVVKYYVNIVVFILTDMLSNIDSIDNPINNEKSCTLPIDLSCVPLIEADEVLISKNIARRTAGPTRLTVVTSSKYSNKLMPGKNFEGLVSKNGKYKVTLRGSTLFMVKKNQKQSLEDIKYLSLSTSKCKRFTMQRDGNLVAYNLDDNPIWASNTESVGNSIYLKLTNKGVLGLFEYENEFQIILKFTD